MKSVGMSQRQFIYFLEPVRATFVADATDAERDIVGAHGRYLEGVLEAGRLILAGRTDEVTPTGIVVFEAWDEEAARKVMEDDPAVKAGVFRARLAPYEVALLRGQASHDD